MRCIALVITSVALLVMTSPLLAASHLVKPDGTGDFPTIQAALDAAAGDRPKG